jgi:hypothetical protein
LTDVALLHGSGGLVSETLLQDLRLEIVSSDVRFLADVAGFCDLADHSPTRAEHESDLQAAFRAGQALWSAHASEFEAGMDIGRLRERLLMPLLGLLGWRPVFQRAHLTAGDASWAITHLGWDAPDAPPLLLIADPDLDHPPAGRRRSAHDELQGFLNASPQSWGIVTNGHVLRLLRDFHHTRTRGFIEFDLVAILEAASFPDFRAFYRLCHVSRFVPSDLRVSSAAAATPGEDEDEEETPEGAELALKPVTTTLLERLYERSVSSGVAAGRRFQPQVRHAIEELANGVTEAEPELRGRLAAEAGFGRELYRELLSVLYRMLFLLFAEQRGMLAGSTPLYDETYSLTHLRALVEEGGVEGRKSDLWEGLKATFTAFSQPELASLLSVYPYNGQLFDAARTPLLNTAHCANRHVLEAVRSLTTIVLDRSVTLHVDYRNLGVEELGTVYESLLDYTLAIAERAEVSASRVIEPGQVYLASLSSERADLGSYYTPLALVQLVLDRALDPLLEERLAEAGPEADAREEAILDFRVIDPACGSGAFLIGAIDRLALALASTRSTPAQPTDAAVAVARRDVLARCIYGVDKDPFAIELAKVALWIHCAVPDAPLSFLDVHLVCGDALIGWPLLEVPDHLPTEAFEAKVALEDKKLLAAARSVNIAELALQGTLLGEMPPMPPLHIELPSLLARPEHDIADVRAKAAAYADYLNSASCRRLKAAADLWTAAFFWTAAHGPLPTTGPYRRALAGNVSVDLAQAAGRVVSVVGPLHWALAFPDVRDRGGFDLVIGNPPWEQFKGAERDFFADVAPEVATLPSKERKQAIEAMAEEDSALYGRWLDYQALQGRQAHYAKVCGRFTRTPNEVNTYVLFTELAADLVGKRGSVGMLVKSGLALDAAQRDVWQKLVAGGRVREVRDIVNVAPLFPAVAAVERFSVLVLGPEGVSTEFGASMRSITTDEASIRPLVRWDAELLRTVCPATGTLISTRENWELDLALELHRRWPTLEFDRTTSPKGRNAWSLAYYTLFHSSGGQKWFHRPEELLALGFELAPDRSMRHADGRVAVPLFEGQMMNRFDHRAKTYEGYSGASKYGPKPNLPKVSDSQHADPTFEVEPRYWMWDEVATKRLDETIGDRALVAYRNVTRPDTDSRSIKAALLFPTPATHAIPLLAVPPELALAFLGLLNSTVFDFLARVHVPGANLTPWVISQCAAPPPELLDPCCADLAGRLSITSVKLADAYGLPLNKWDTETRSFLEAECDARVARSYGLSRDQYDQLFEHFSVLGRVEKVRFGEQRTRRLCLEVFDRLEQEGLCNR